MPKRYPKLCAAALLIFCTAMPFVQDVEAKGKKGKSSATRGRGKSARRAAARKARHPAASYAVNSETDYAIVPDEIEVHEYGSSNPSELAQWLNLSNKAVPASYSEPDLTAPAKRRNVKIDSRRVVQIQQALASRGFFQGEMNGVYDETTIDSMRRFQAANKISVTGYPTAQALNRLGLSNKW